MIAAICTHTNNSHHKLCACMSSQKKIQIRESLFARSSNNDYRPILEPIFIYVFFFLTIPLHYEEQYSNNKAECRDGTSNV